MGSSNYKTYDHVYNIFVEGCIGEGKSTLCKNLVNELRKNTKCVVVTSDELVDPILVKEFYKNQRAVMPAFQANMITTRISQKVCIANVVESKLNTGLDIYIINDTGFFTDQVFIDTGLEYGNMGNDVADMLNNLRVMSNNFASQLFIKPTHVVLLSSTSKKCMLNIKKRAQVDALIPQEYMKMLHKKYQEHYTNAKKENEGVKFITLDTKGGFASAADVLKMI